MNYAFLCTDTCVRLPPIPSVPVLPRCTYNVSSESLLSVGIDACNRVLPPADAQLTNSTPVEITSKDFSECLTDLNTTLCEMQLCTISDQLSCSLSVCEVAADSNIGESQTNLDVYIICFSTVIQSLASVPDMPPNTDYHLNSVAIVTVNWFEYCIQEIDSIESCVSILLELCFSGALDGSTSQCLMAMPSVCAIFGFLPGLQQQCVVIVENVVSGTLPSTCGQSTNVQTCVSSYMYLYV